MLISTDLRRPKDFHEIAWLGLGKIIEVTAQIELVKKPGCARAVCVPTAPDSFTIALVTNHELIQGGEVEIKLTVGPKRLDCLNENQIRRA